MDTLRQYAQDAIGYGTAAAQQAVQYGAAVVDQDVFGGIPVTQTLAPVVEHKLYQAGSSALEAVDPHGTARQSIRSAAGAAQDLYDRQRSRLSQVKARVQRHLCAANQTIQQQQTQQNNIAGPLKYVNPTFYTGNVLSGAGRLVSYGGQAISAGGRLAERAGNALDPVSKGVANFDGGAFEALGDAVSGIGDMADQAGQMESGNLAALNKAADTAVNVTQGAVYLQGRVDEATGRVIEGAGNRLNSNALRQAGAAEQAQGRFERSLATPTVQRTVDMVAGAAVNLSARGGALQGQLFSAAGFKQTGEQMQRSAVELQQRTADNSLVRRFDAAEAEVKRDPVANVSRATGYVAGTALTLLVGPESLAADGTRAADATVETGRALSSLARRTESLEELGQATTRTAQVTREAGATSEAVAENPFTALRTEDIVRQTQEAQPKMGRPELSTDSVTKMRREIPALLEAQESVNSIAPETLAKVDAYQDGANVTINTALREAQSADATTASRASAVLAEPRNAEIMRGLDRAISSARIPEDTTVYRGSPLYGRTAQDFERLAQNGGTFTDAGYTSTSLIAEGARLGNPDVIFETRLPAGSKGLYLNASESLQSMGLANENEVLLPRGSTFRVTGVDHTPDGKLLVRTEFVP